MFDDINSTLHHRVLAAYERYRNERDSCRTGSNKLLDASVDLAIAIHHFPEHLPPNLGVARSLHNPDLIFLSEVANASKHSERKWGVQQYLKRADALAEVAFRTEFLDAAGHYLHCDVRVMASCLDGIERDLDPALIGSLNFWIAHLSSKGVTKPLRLKPAASPGTAFIDRSAARGLAIVVNRQTDAVIQLRCQRFNPVTLVPEPIDLTGSQGEFRVFSRPSMELAVKLTHPDLSQPLETSVRLTAQEADDLEAATQLGLRDAKIEQIAHQHKAELESQLVAALRTLDKNTTRT